MPGLGAAACMLASPGRCCSHSGEPCWCESAVRSITSAADAGAEGAAAAALRNAVKAEQLPDPTLPVSSAGQSSADRPASCIARLPGLMLLPRLLAGSGRILHQILLLPCPVLPD